MLAAAEIETLKKSEAIGSGSAFGADVTNNETIVNGITRDLENGGVLSAIRRQRLECGIELDQWHHCLVMNIDKKLGGVGGPVEEGCGDRLRGRSSGRITEIILGRFLEGGERIGMA